jgi:dimethylargininase
VAEETLLIDPAWVDGAAFEGMRLIETDSEERHAANALLIGERVIYAAAYPRTRKRLEQADIPVAAVDMSELAKAEGGLTCCSLVFAI